MKAGSEMSEINLGDSFHLACETFVVISGRPAV